MTETPEQDSSLPPYQITHTAPADDGYSRPIAELTEAFAPDVYEHPDWYGTPDTETLDQLNAVRNSPEAELTIYRAVPPEHLEINRGDWVTLSRQYAEEHAYDLTTDGDGVVVSASVPASQIFTDGNDIAEYGYVGECLNLGAGTNLEGGEKAVSGSAPTVTQGVSEAQLKKALEARQFAVSQQRHAIGHAAAGQGKPVNKVKTNAPQKSQTQSKQRGR